MMSPQGDSPPDRFEFRYSIVIPVFNSERLVGDTVDEVVRVFTEAGLEHEVILVNDGSSDGSWEVIAEKARTLPKVIALDLLHNYGQHHANMAGLR
ncbi:MAG: glycosyltransferase, partial [Acidimicrobiia bacterium]|nr:glycosyltransferase [Acidimicrobiia bacterium]